jgi:hypothetical protein
MLQVLVIAIEAPLDGLRLVDDEKGSSKREGAAQLEEQLDDDPAALGSGHPGGWRAEGPGGMA